MYGAILGDIIGSPYEFNSRNYKAKDFPLFSSHSHFTDDTVMTLAVAEALMDSMERGKDSTTCLIHSMQRLGRKYPNCGFGGMFYHWVMRDNPMPYHSYGNGSAMRVSSAAWLFNDLNTTKQFARITACVSHNHPEGIKGAEAVAAAIYLARTGHKKDEIKTYIEENTGYNLSRTCDEIRPNYRMNETCQGSIPEAFTAFLEGNSFEDVIRNAVSLGGDSDTIACIAGSMAEAYFDVPEALKAECRDRLPSDLLEIMNRFERFTQRN